ncbi:MAG: hypothetical protein ABFS56_17375 [Pseudomonadota bacterium]
MSNTVEKTTLVNGGTCTHNIPNNRQTSGLNAGDFLCRLGFAPSGTPLPGRVAGGYG